MFTSDRLVDAALFESLSVVNSHNDIALLAPSTVFYSADGYGSSQEILYNWISYV